MQSGDLLHFWTCTMGVIKNTSVGSMAKTIYLQIPWWYHPFWNSLKGQFDDFPHQDGQIKVRKLERKRNANPFWFWGAQVDLKSIFRKVVGAGVQYFKKGFSQRLSITQLYWYSTNYIIALKFWKANFSKNFPPSL